MYMSDQWYHIHVHIISTLVKSCKIRLKLVPSLDDNHDYIYIYQIRLKYIIINASYLYVPGLFLFLLFMGMCNVYTKENTCSQ